MVVYISIYITLMLYAYLYACFIVVHDISLCGVTFYNRDGLSTGKGGHPEALRWFRSVRRDTNHEQTGLPTAHGTRGAGSSGGVYSASSGPGGAWSAIKQYV